MSAEEKRQSAAPPRPAPEKRVTISPHLAIFSEATRERMVKILEEYSKKHRWLAR